MTKIYTLTLAPSLDSATQTPQIYPEGKLRCSAPVFEPGGGGINVARAVTFLGGKPPPFSRSVALPASILPPCWPMSRCRSRQSKPATGRGKTCTSTWPPAANSIASLCPARH